MTRDDSQNIHSGCSSELSQGIPQRVPSTRRVSLEYSSAHVCMADPNALKPRSYTRAMRGYEACGHVRI